MGSFIKDKEKNKCCTDGGNGDQDPKDCLEKWEIELKQVCNTYTIEAAETNKLQTAYSNSLVWETKLKNWCDLIESTDEKVKAVVTELDFLLEQIKTVCAKSKCTYQVLEKLTCLVKTIFDSLFTYSTDAEGLKTKITKLKELIKCLKDVDSKDQADVIACIEAYETKIKVICDLQDAVLTKLLETLKCATLLWAYICSETGLENKLEDMKTVLTGSIGEDVENCGPEDEEPEGDPKYPCDDKKAKPLPVFPIKNETSGSNGTPTGNDYYVKIKEEYQVAQDKTKTLKDDWVESKKLSDKTLLQKNSLTDAIKAAKAAKVK